MSLRIPLKSQIAVRGIKKVTVRVNHACSKAEVPDSMPASSEDAGAEIVVPLGRLDLAID